MTAQFADQFLYQGQEYSIAEVNGEPLYHPAQHGIVAEPTCSACWRGYLATYTLRGALLVLHQLEVTSGSSYGPHSGKPDAPAINGVRPTYPSGRNEIFDLRYAEIGLLVPFTGGLLIGRGFVRELYVHMGFHPAWKFEQVHELLFESGRLTEAQDISERMAKFRADRSPLEGNRPASPGGMD